MGWTMTTGFQRNLDGDSAATTMPLWFWSDSYRGFYSTILNKWIIVPSADYLLPPLWSADTGFLYRAPYRFNGLETWIGNACCVCNTYTDGWVLLQSNIPHEPVAVEHLNGTWTGEGWWKLSGSFVFPNGILSCTGRGTKTGVAHGTIHFKWPRYERNSAASRSSTAPCGIYYPRSFDEAHSAITVGTPTWTATIGEDSAGTFVRTSDNIYTWSGGAGYEAGALVYKNGIWRVGNAATAWWQGEGAPSIHNARTYVAYHKVEGVVQPDEYRAPLILTFHGFGATKEPRDLYMAEAAQWR